jgi:hypothetical protein
MFSSRRNMTLFTVLLAAITRKVKAVIAEYRKLVAEVRATESKLVESAQAEAAIVLGSAKAEEAKLLVEARNVILFAKARESTILFTVETQTKNLYEEVINKIAKL